MGQTPVALVREDVNILSIHSVSVREEKDFIAISDSVIYEVGTDKLVEKYINNGFAKKFDDLAKIKILKNSGKVKFSIFKSKPRKFPLKIEMLERHPLATQLFFPISKYGFIVVVCANKDKPSINMIKSFF